MLSLLFSQVCRGNFPKHSECFRRILGVKIWQAPRLLKTHMLNADKIELVSFAAVVSVSLIPCDILAKSSNRVFKLSHQVLFKQHYRYARIA